MLEVEVKCLKGHPARDITVGIIALDDSGKLIGTSAAPEYDRLIKNILSSPIKPVGGGRISPTDKENWIQNLYREYKSYALRCTKPVERKVLHLPGQHIQESHGNWAGEEGQFFSPLSRALELAKQQAAPASDWISILSKGGITKDELQATGIIEHLRTLGNQKVTRDELLAFAREHAVKVNVVMLGQNSQQAELDSERVSLDRERDRLSKDLYDDLYGPMKLSPEERQNLRDRIAALDKRRDEIRNQIKLLKPTKFEQYTLPGGENYREMLLTLPSSPLPAPITELPPGYEVVQRPDGWTVLDANGVRFQFGSTPEHAKELALADINKTAEIEAKRASPDFRSGHFDEPNVLAHVRMDDRTDASGNRVLFVEEIQSDWAQQGRQKGFRSPLTPVERAELNALETAMSGGYMQSGRELTADEKVRLRELTGISAAPFVTDTKSWVSLAMNHVIAEATNKGYGAVAWTTGEQQADRYSLAKAVDSITWAGPGERQTYVTLKGVKGISNQNIEIGVNKQTGVIDVADLGAPGDWEGKSLADVVGKDIAKKILSSPSGELKEEGLKVGGEGMRAFYDQIVPQITSRLIKRHDPAANLAKIKTVFADLTDIDIAKEAGDKIPLHEQPGFYITPKMREQIKRGISLFEDDQGWEAYHLPGQHIQETHGNRGGRLADKAISEGGFTYNPVRYKDREPPKKGYALGLRKDTEATILLAAHQSRREVRSLVTDYVSQHRSDIKAPGNYLGGWVDNGKLYLDISTVVTDKNEAIELARRNDQLGIYDLEKGETIMIPKRVT